MEGINILKGRDWKMVNKEMAGTIKKDESHFSLKKKIKKNRSWIFERKQNKA